MDQHTRQLCPPRQRNKGTEIYLTGWGLVGGGGADIDWDVALGIGYEINERISAIAGYRALGVDYSNDGFLFDAVQQGPIVGLAINF